jgi:hypothetical protein
MIRSLPHVRIFAAVTRVGFLAILAACSNRAGPPSLPPVPQQPSFGNVSNARPATVGGVITTRTFTVASGKTISVSKNLAVFASTAVEIDGTLNVPRGISVAFFSPSFTLRGFIYAPTNKKYTGAVNDLVSACQIYAAARTNWFVGAGDNLAFTSSKKRGSSKPCTVYVGATGGGSASQTITLQPGVQGGTDKKRPLGQNGGWIEIGTPQAIAATQKLAKKDKHGSLKAYAPDVVELNSQLAAGNGGKGKSDDNGKLSGETYTFTARSGGIGGSVQVVAGKITGSVPQIFAGTGGNGGDLATALAEIYGIPFLLDSSDPAAPNGLSAVLTMGAGGGGGEVVVKAKTPATIDERSGDGGNPSAFPNPTGAGSSCCSTVTVNTPTFTGNGGSFTLYLAAPGKRGPGGNDRPTVPKNGSYQAMTFNGGDGSANLNFYAGAGASVQGGTGGDLTIVPPQHLPMSALGGYGLSITVDYFGEGASSLENCNGVPPSPAGLNGGNGGSLHDNGLMPYITVIDYPPTPPATGAPSFEGGDGSNGTPPGNGGKGGSNDEGAHIGQDGAQGAAC